MLICHKIAFLFVYRKHSGRKTDLITHVRKKPEPVLHQDIHSAALLTQIVFLLFAYTEGFSGWCEIIDAFIYWNEHTG
jgi:hypothetical protein